MEIRNIRTIVICLAAILCNGCKTDVNLNELDTHAEVAWKVAFPIGSLIADLGDFVEEGVLNNVYVADDTSGYTLYFRDTAHITRQYHDVDLASKVSSADKICNVHDALAGLLRKDSITGHGNTIKLTFPYVLHLNHINDSVQKERLDSAQISEALFTSNVTTRILPGLKANFVKHIEIGVGEEFHHIDHNLITVYDSLDWVSDFEFGEDIDISVDEFVIDLLDHKKSTDNHFVVKDSCVFNIYFYITIPQGVRIYIPPTAAFQYHMDVQFIHYDAIWGYFNPSNQMRDHGTIDLYEELDIWHNFRQFHVPLSDPVVELSVTTQVAGAMKMYGEYLYSQTKDAPISNRRYATFDQAMTQRDVTYFWNQEGHLTQPHLYEGGYMHPTHSAIGDSVCYHLLFDKNWQNGHIDNLCTIRPDSLGYKFQMFFDTLTTPQIRIVPNTSVRIDADFIIPFQFNAGTELVYQFILDNVDLSEVSLDSLCASSSKLDSITMADIAIVMGLENTIPLHIRAVCHFFDAKGDTIKDPTHPEYNLRFSSADTLALEVPTLHKNAANEYEVQSPGMALYTLYLDKEHFDIFHQIKSIHIELFADSREMDTLYPDYHVKLSGNNAVKIDLGITTVANAVFHLSE